MPAQEGLENLKRAEERMMAAQQAHRSFFERPEPPLLRTDDPEQEAHEWRHTGNE
jgi:hypothetical protein